MHRLSWFAILGLLSLFCGLGDLATAAERPPNIVFILADDLGYGDVRCLNPVRGQIPTPHMDRLAAQGMVFTDAHSTSAVCTPSRYALLTGRYNWRTRLQQGVLGGFSPPLIAADRLTLPGLLRQHGYRTACLGESRGHPISVEESRRHPMCREPGPPYICERIRRAGATLCLVRAGATLCLWKAGATVAAATLYL